jgi:hypothetical protein
MASRRARRDAVGRGRDALLSTVHYRIIVADILGPLGALANSAAPISPDTSPRGVKRSRSPDTYGDLPADDNFGEDGTLLPHARRPSPVATTCLLRARAGQAAGRRGNLANDGILR